MFSLKKISLAVILLSGHSVFAGTMGNVCTPSNLTTPCDYAGWKVGGRALYLQPSYSDNGFLGAISTTSVVGTVASASDNFVSSQKWDWGFMIEGDYQFNNGNDLNLNWYHWNNTTHLNYNTAGNQNFTDGYLTYVGNTTASWKPQWDAVNLEFGERINFPSSGFVHFYGGGQWARITAKGTISAAGAITLVGPSLTLTGAGASINNTHIGFNGFGPRVGADLVYDFGNQGYINISGLNIYAKAASTLLVGKTSFNSDILASIGTTHFTGGIVGSFTEVVPELEGKLGASYDVAFFQNKFSLDAGWMWVNYFNALIQGSTPPEYISTNFALQGPYFGLTWTGNLF